MAKILAFVMALGWFGSSMEDCAMKSPCICLDDTGSGINLSELSSLVYLEADQGSKKFFFHPCADTKSLPTPPVNVSVDNVCNKDGYSVNQNFSVKKRSHIHELRLIS